jgi:hypothetical protein
MTLPGYIEAIAADWETYSPMTREDVAHLIEHIATHEGPAVLCHPNVVDHWGIQAAIGNWDTATALHAVRDFYARVPRAVWTGDGPEAGTLRPVLPLDITSFVRAVRRYAEDEAAS